MSERVARELTPLLDDPVLLRDTFSEAVETAPRDATGAPRVTAAHVRETVERRAQSVQPSYSTQMKAPVTGMVTDAIRHVVTTAKAGEPAAIRAAIAAAKHVIKNQRSRAARMELAACATSLLSAMAFMLKGKP